MQRNTLNPLFTAAFAAFFAVAVLGCGAADADTGERATPEPDTQAVDTSSTDDDSATASGGTGEAELSYEGTTFTAQLQHCSLQGEDALFHGPAFDDSGTEVGYLDGDFGNLTDVPYGEVRIDFGATGQFESSEEFIAMGDSIGHIVITDFSDSNLNVAGGIWDQDATQLGTGVLKVSC